MKKILLACMFAIGVGTSAQTYCIPAFSNGCSDGDQIDSFEIPSASFSHLNTGCSSGAYGDYTSQTINLQIGTPYSYSVTHNYSSQNVRIWIDLNNDFSFDEVTELVAANSANGLITNGTIMIPTTATPGTYRMRVADLYASQPTPCNFDGFGEAHDYTVTLTAPSCWAVSGVTVPSVTQLTANISWTAPSTAPSNGYQVYYSTSSTAPTAGITLDATNSVTSNTTSATINGLTPATDYYVWVRSNCGATQSVWMGATFKTLCTTFASPFTETFSNGSLPNCWSNFSTDNTSYALWQFSGIPDYGTTNNGNTPGTFAWIDASVPYTGVHDVTLESPAIDLAGLTVPLVEFKWFKNHATTSTGTTPPAYDNNKLTVQVKDITASTWETIFTGDTNSTVWRTESIALAASYVNKTIQLRFIVDKDVAGNGYFYDNLLLDDVKVKQAPTCLVPTGLAAANPQVASIDVSWVAPASAPANGYEIYYSTSSTAPTAVTPLDATNSVTSATTTATIGGLASATTYYIWVRSACSTSDKSDWAGPVNKTTTCTSTNVPYLQDFESVTTPDLPICTSIENAGTGNNWKTGTGLGSKALNYSYHSTNPANAWFYTQGINLTAGTSYRIKYIYGNSSTTYPEKLKVAYGTSAANTAMTTVLADHQNIINGAALATAIQNTVDFTPTTTGVYYFGFNAYSDADMNQLYVDNISIDTTPTCIEPSAITVSNPQLNSIDVSWTAPATAPANGYEVYYSTTNTAPTAGTPLDATNSVTSATTTATVNGLSSATTYYFWVRSSCSTSDKSYWIGSASMSTVCSSVNIPYTEDFENATVPAIPNCTATENVGTGNNWETIASSPSYGFNSKALVYRWNSSSPANTWFYTKGLNLTAGTQYKLTFLYGGTGIYTENMKVAYGTSPSAAGMTTQLQDYPNITISSPSAETILFTPTTTGVYYIGFNCYSDADMFYLFVDDINVTENVLATNEATVAKSVKVYPNPFKDILNISDVDNVKNITVMDISGRIIKTIEKVSSTLNLSDLKEGLYLVNLNYKDGKTTSVKVIKK